MTDFGSFPQRRMRRLRKQSWLRDLCAQTHLHVNDLIWPAFVKEDDDPTQAIASMPGVQRYRLDELIPAIEEAAALGIKAVAIFPVIDPKQKTEDGEQAVNPDNLICRTVRAVKQSLGDRMGVICDVALDPFTTHGHDGLLRNDDVDNDATLEILAQQALVQADAGCDILAPSDMMDGRVGILRDALDKDGYQDRAILSYAAKYASGFYGPFRDALGSGKKLGAQGKKTYQMNPANTDEALQEVALDIAEGADMVMVKPAMPYLDVIHRVKQRFEVPTFAYQVSGEYAMLEAAAAQGWLDRDTVIAESLLAIKRAGADAILTYHAIEMARQLHR